MKEQIRTLVKEEIMGMSNGIIIEINGVVAPKFKNAMKKSFPKDLDASKILGAINKMPQDKIIDAIQKLSMFLQSGTLKEAKKPTLKKIASIISDFTTIRMLLKYILPRIGAGGIAGYSTPMSIVLILLYFLLMKVKNKKDVGEDTASRLVRAGLV